ncbi:hypothetical protein ACO0LL_18300 [Undibacterium sp. TC4M20W]|uniref:hypothetical protein n=1 Tax=unclassified Undibacterium TaxID=2630295 RepID=UPI003BEF6DEA
MYEGPKLERKDAALLFLHTRPNMKYRQVDGVPVNFVYDGDIKEFKPGLHRFTVEVSTYQARGGPSLMYFTTEYDIATFELEVNMRVGYTYVLDYRDVNVPTLPKILCMEGEAHDAPGSRVNVTGEVRIMSPTVQKFGCREATSIRHHKSS